jgi:hypothetical protein
VEIKDPSVRAFCFRDFHLVSRLQKAMRHVSAYHVILTLQTLFSCANAFQVPTVSHARRPETPLVLLKMSSEPQKVSSLDDRAVELEAMGGDPFFLSDNDDDDDDDEKSKELDDATASFPSLSSEFMKVAATISPKSPVHRFITDGLGPSPKNRPSAPQTEFSNDVAWEWDGVVDEDAHLDIDDW